MSIEGINILTQRIVYGPTWYGITAWIIMLTITFFLTSLWLIGYEKEAGFITGVCFIFTVIFLVLTFHSINKTICNQPSKIEYTIEIMDNSAWKKIGPNYTVKEKVYENKEIYIVEGDYTE